MTPAAWRTVLLSTCGIVATSAVLVIFGITGIAGKPPWAGHWGTDRDSVPFGMRIVDVDAGGPSDRAGLRVGDVVDFRDLPLRERYWFAIRPLSGRPITLPVRRGALHRRIVVTPTPITGFVQSWRRFAIFALSFFAIPALTIWLAFFAALIVWRRAGDLQMRLLALALLAYGAQMLLTTGEWTTPWLWPNLAQDFLGDVSFFLTLALWTALATRVAGPPSPVRMLLAWLSYVMAALVASSQFASSIGFVTLWYDPNAPFATGPLYVGASYAAPFVALLCSILAIGASRGAERQRSAWILVPLTVLLVAPTAELLLFNSLARSYYVTNFIVDVQLALQFLAPAGLTYAALNRRLLDVGFVLNQAAVFSGVSLSLVGLFMLFEWLIGSWLGRVSHATNVAISAALVLSLGFSVRVIHTRVERVLDRAFFRKRHDDEAAILNFAERAADATDSATLVLETKEALGTHADAEFVALVMDDGKGHYGDVSQSDPAIVALCGRHKALDLKSLATQLPGEFAYPMIARGRLVGALLLGPKRSGNNYAPDESHAIMQLAREVGAALHVLTLAKVLEEHRLQV